MSITDTPIIAKPSATLQQAMAWARRRRAERLGEVDAFLAELWRLALKVGLDPAVLAAQSSHETDGWTSQAWIDRLNPAGIGVTDGGDDWLGWDTGTLAAQAQIVHMVAYAKGFRGLGQLTAYLPQDPRWWRVAMSGEAGKVKRLADLTGRWATDPNYAAKIGDHLRQIRDTVQTPGPTPGTNPPPGIEFVGTGNWSERTFDQKPFAIVYHITDDMNVKNVIGWFQDPRSSASSHFVIDRNGSIYQCVSTTRAAWTNGDIKTPRQDIPWLNEAVRRNRINNGPMSLNDYTITIEHVGTPRIPPTDAQYQSSIALSIYAQRRYGIAAGRGRQLRHADINSVDRGYCPGPRFDLARIILACGGDPEDLTR